jgi:hypothetical protein
MFTRLRLIPVVVLLTLVLPAAAVAQDVTETAAVQVTTVATDTTAATAATPASAGPRLEHTAIAARAASEPVESASMQGRPTRSRSVALMIVGGAAIVLGSIIGGDAGTLFAIGGAVALLYGLYHYLQ